MCTHARRQKSPPVLNMVSGTIQNQICAHRGHPDCACALQAISSREVCGGGSVRCGSDFSPCFPRYRWYSYILIGASQPCNQNEWSSQPCIVPPTHSVCSLAHPIPSFSPPNNTLDLKGRRLDSKLARCHGDTLPPKKQSKVKLGSASAALNTGPPKGIFERDDSDDAVLAEGLRLQYQQLEAECVTSSRVLC